MSTPQKSRWANHLIELVIVIIGISIAFWINSLAEDRKEEKQRQAYVKDIKMDLEKDVVRLERIIKSNKDKSGTMQQGLALAARKVDIDSLLPYVVQIGFYDFFTPEDFTLRSLLQSGDFKLLKSPELKKELLRLMRGHDRIDEMQRNFLKALDENFFPKLLMELDMSTGEVVNANFFYSVQVKNYFGFANDEANRGIDEYSYALEKTRQIIEFIK